MEIEDFMKEIKEDSEERIKKIHHLAKKIWERKGLDLIDVRNKCLDVWDDMKYDANSSIVPLVNLPDERRPTNLIFGSGSFSTGDFQAEQYEEIAKIVEKPPIKLQGIVANKSADHGCNGAKIARKHNLKLVELDYEDWYHDFIDRREENPIRATRYWYSPKDESRPSISEINSRFKIRQNKYHKALGEKIDETFQQDTNIVSLRGYNFQVCSNIFKHQLSKMPHYNDTHPADLSYIHPKKKHKLYAGWQSGAVKKMMEDGGHDTYRGSLIEVKNMDKISQIHELDEGALMGLGKGVTPKEGLVMTADQIQDALKIIDDYFFCTWEASGLILLFGITRRKVPVVFQTLEGKREVVKQRAIVVGNKFHSGVQAWGQDLDENIKEIEDFLWG